MYRDHPQFSALLEGMDTQLADACSAAAALAAAGSGDMQAGSASSAAGVSRSSASNSEVVVRASSLLAGSFSNAAGRTLSTSQEDALPPAEQLLAFVGSSPLAGVCVALAGTSIAAGFVCWDAAAGQRLWPQQLC
jgi:hypothetical protein